MVAPPCNGKLTDELPVLINFLVQHSRRWAAGIVAVNVFAALWLATLDRASPEPPTMPVAANNSLRLLSESATPHPLCYAWGPFSNRKALDVVQEELAALGAVPRIAVNEVRGNPDYLVFIGPESSRDAMRRIRRELTALDIESHIIVQGEYSNRVSVGVFSRQSQALAQKDRVAALGYEVEIEELDRSHEVLHVFADVNAGFSASVPPTGRCGDIAQPDQFL